jgi:hypothetical protein
MIKAEPVSILRFLATYYDIIKELYNIQNKEGIIRHEELTEICARHDHDVHNQLKEYKILRSVNADYELRDVYYKLVEFILYEFKPMLPETFEKYFMSMSELYRKIKEGVNGDKMILSERIINLQTQIREFLDGVEKNTVRLLHETRELKANVDKVDYRVKVHKASFWIEYYIIPLNQVLNVNYADSVANKLLEISDFANQRRLNFDEEGLRIQFEKLYNQLIQTNDDLLRQSKILTNELLPLIERIRTESLILTGWIEFLRNPYKVTTPKILKSNRSAAYNKNLFFHTKEFFEQFMDDEEVFIDEQQLDHEQWIFNKTNVKAKLKEQVPVQDFFGWCRNELMNEFNEVDAEKFFAMCTLLFEEDLEKEFSDKGTKVKIKTQHARMTVPKIKILN